jgi:hypothetical protein
MTYVFLAVVILMLATYYAAYELHNLMEVRQVAHELPSSSGTD